MSTASTWLPRAGDVIDRYQVITEIARGGMAAVYAVRSRSFGGFGRMFALKVLLPHLRAEKHFVDMFLDEARLASAVHHPNVVQVFDLGREHECPYLVMEWVRGISLATLAERARSSGVRIPAGVALRLLGQAAEGLHAAHETRGEDGEPLDIVHRDVSPHNVLVGFDGHARVADFGIAAGRGKLTATRSEELRGKLGYLAPEQVKRLHRLDRRVDVWSMGVTAFEILSGRRLFDCEDEAALLWEVVSGELPNLTEELSEVGPTARRTIARCLERDRQSRLEDCGRLARAFLEEARALGCDGAEEVSRFVCELFAEERTALESLLALETPANENVAPESVRTQTNIALPSALPRPDARWALFVFAAAGAVSLAVSSWPSASDGRAPAGPAIVEARAPLVPPELAEKAAGPTPSDVPAPSVSSREVARPRAAKRAQPLPRVDSARARASTGTAEPIRRETERPSPLFESPYTK